MKNCFSEDPAFIAIFHNNDTRASFMIHKKSFNGSLLDFTRYHFDRIQKNHEDFTLINDNKTTINGYPAWQMEITYKKCY